MERAPQRLWSKGSALLAFGFVVNLVGLVGGALWLEPAERAVQSASLEMTLEDARARVIGAATSFFETSQHMGSLVFTVPAGRDRPDDVRAMLGELFRRGVDRGRNGFRAYIAELALAGAIDFDATSKQYEALAAAERANLSMDTFRAANAFEADLAMAMVNAQGAASMRAIELQKIRREARTTATRRRLTLTLTALAGSVIVLVATLGRGNPEQPEPGAAVRALAAALERLRTKEAHGDPGETGVS